MPPFAASRIRHLGIPRLALGVGRIFPKTSPHATTIPATAPTNFLVESKEKERNAFESVAYLLLIVAMSAALWQFSNQPAAFTGLGLAASKTVAAQEASLRS